MGSIVSAVSDCAVDAFVRPWPCYMACRHMAVDSALALWPSLISAKIDGNGLHQVSCGSRLHLCIKMAASFKSRPSKYAIDERLSLYPAAAH